MERTELAERWAAWFAEYNAGEITRKAFCEARGVKLSTFDYWRQRLRKNEAQKTELEGSWTYSESPAFVSQHSVFFVYTRGQEDSGLTGYNDSGGHFVNSAGAVYFDPWGGSGGSRPFTPAQTDMIEWASGAAYGPADQRKLSNVRGMRNLWF